MHIILIGRLNNCLSIFGDNATISVDFQPIFCADVRFYFNFGVNRRVFVQYLTFVILWNLNSYPVVCFGGVIIAEWFPIVVNSYYQIGSIKLITSLVIRLPGETYLGFRETSKLLIRIVKTLAKRFVIGVTSKLWRNPSTNRITRSINGLATKKKEKKKKR